MYLPKYKITIGMTIPELGISFNAQNIHIKCSVVLVSNIYYKNCCNIAQIAQNGALIAGPSENIETLESYMKTQTDVSLEYRGIGNSINIVVNPDFFVKAYKLCHTIPCVGYGLVNNRVVTKKEYIGLSKCDLIELRKSGKILTEKIDEHIFVYMDDTTIDIFETMPELLGYQYIMIYCQYYEKNDVYRAKCEKRVHWNELLPFIMSHQSNKFILITKMSDPHIPNVILKQSEI